MTGRSITVAALQASFGQDIERNIACVADLIREAAAAGAQVILPPELFQGPYFCVSQEERWFAHAHPWREHPCVTALAPLAAELRVVLPISIFEREGPHYFNTLVMIGPDGEPLGIYRKSHIPDGPGYQEKYYFKPGDTGFRVWDTPFGRLGVGVCWDQWYPEAARAMMLLGAEVLLYPTAIGSEPHDPTLDTAQPWRRAMQGPRRFQHRARRRRQPHRIRAVAGLSRRGPDLLWLQLRRRPSRGSGCGARSRAGGGGRGELRSRLPRRPSRRLGLLSRSAARSIRRPGRAAPGVIETERLILRRWRAADRGPYVAMMADPQVGYWLGGPRDREAALAEIAGFEESLARDGFGWLAVERRGDGAFLGTVVLARLRENHPAGSGVEVGWRFAREAWGFGYATEAARALLDDGFRRLSFREIVAFTGASNTRSRAVMERSGMRRDPGRDFDHPNLAVDHPLRRHVLYAATNPLAASSA